MRVRATCNQGTNDYGAEALAEGCEADVSTDNGRKMCANKHAIEIVVKPEPPQEQTKAAQAVKETAPAEPTSAPKKRGT